MEAEAYLSMMARSTRSPRVRRNYEGRGVFIAGHLVWSRNSLGVESIPHICSLEEDPETVATELQTALDASDPIPSGRFIPAPLSARDLRHRLRLV